MRRQLQLVLALASRTLLLPDEMRSCARRRSFSGAAFLCVRMSVRGEARCFCVRECERECERERVLTMDFCPVVHSVQMMRASTEMAM